MAAPQVVSRPDGSGDHAERTRIAAFDRSMYKGPTALRPAVSVLVY